jgi:hypothetical protein
MEVMNVTFPCIEESVFWKHQKNSPPIIHQLMFRLKRLELIFILVLQVQVC